jgi:3-hydroxyacyl-CoA dehydrogenase/enoyl-CoA hydratase/3-hydroxybutyryl-CoA epimerase
MLDSPAGAPPAAPDARDGDPHLRLEGEGIASIVFASDDAGPNVLGTAELDRLDEILARVEHGVSAGAVRAVVLRSARPGSWVSGADLREVRAIRTAAEGAAVAARGQGVLRRLERLAVPTVAAVDGACLGAGAELALACSYRLASDSPETVFGFPEVRYGLLPALGGTVRLPRLVGIRAALELILTGRSVAPAEALALGLADEVVPAEELEARALAFARERIERGRRRTGAKRGMTRRLVEDTAPGRRALFARVRRGLERAAGGRNPAGFRVLEVVAEAIALPVDEAFAHEAAAFGELAMTPEAHGLMHAFSLRRIARRPPGVPDVPGIAVHTVALLGGGVPAGSLAHLLASRGVAVRLRDRDRAAVADALRWVQETARWERGQGRTSADQARATVDLVTGAPGFGGFGTVELAVELVVGRQERKQAALREAEEHLRDDALLASTALDLSVAGLSNTVARPERLAGLRFFPSPSDPRVAEIVRGPATAEAAVATLHALARRLEVPALVVGDAPGGVLHRLATAYVQEAVALLAEGASVQEVDGAARELGMADGPLAVADAVGLPALARIAAALPASEDPARSSAALDALVRREVLGVQAGRGFYLYTPGRPPRVSEDVSRLLLAEDAAPRIPPATEAIGNRLLLTLVNEAAHLLDEGVVSTADEVDLAAIVGLGFPAFLGGLLYHADQLGLPAVMASLQALAVEHAPRFAPAPLLRRLAAEGRGFHDE